MICQVCSIAGDLLVGKVAMVDPSEESPVSEWIDKAIDSLGLTWESKKSTVAVVEWLHNQCRSVTQDKTWCDCQHKLESSRQKEFVSADKPAE